MKKNDIVREVSRKTNFTIENTETAINAFIEVMREAMKAGEDKIVMKGVGSFNRKVQKARKCRNPKTGEPVDVPEKVSYSFKMSNMLKDELNG